MVHYPNFDFLRHLAAYLVLVGHCFELWGTTDPMLSSTGIESLGGVGVCIFFAISGFLVSDSAIRSVTLYEFARKRILRVYPALFVNVALIALVIGPLTSSLTFSDYFANRLVVDYFCNLALSFQAMLPGVVSRNPIPGGLNGSLWTLPFELKLYIVLSFSTHISNQMLKSFFLFLLCVASVVFAVWHFYSPASTVVWFDTSSYAAVKLMSAFATGVLARILRLEKPQAALALALALAVTAMFLAAYNSKYLWLNFALLVAGLTLLLGLSSSSPRIFQHFKHTDLSFGCYLWAFPIQQSVLHMRPKIDLISFVVVVTVLTSLTAYISWSLIERRFLRYSKTRSF